ncbi:putative fatty-acid--CoA ligase [Sphingomonas changbaiensis NBRC 104936]|uniref:Putative fatty-acid--CoA ligase n=1 Tax=Sphingomonas changbaiensis NBRC 104936 TaxID=1219043 RepID=A0A0E9MPJ1_9SPHN|nr:AMP-binding protein [Sphingomonas changbaiensis]GAO39403.1 putative fatty-acid--CoA ligase [Sphingomonas changbaiensis NBRC 104936]
MIQSLFPTLRAGFRGDLFRPALIEASGAVLSYADLLARSGAMAAALLARGLKAGDRIVVQTSKSVDALLLYLAALRAGIVYVPLNPAHTRAELDYFLEDAEPGLFVDDAELARLAAAPVADFAEPALGPDDLAAILYTSGTTGRSKGALLSQGNLASNAATLIREWRFTEADRLIHALPIFHVHGLFVATHCVIGSGAAMLWQPGFDADAIVRALPDASVLMGVPTFYTRLLAKDGLTPDLCGNMRLFVSGSAPLSAETHREWQARTGHRILERYGMTETGMLSSNPYDGDRRAGSVGPPLPGVAIRIAGADADGVGGIEVKGPNVTRGYWRNAEKTAEAFTADGWFETGDLGRFDGDGYLWIVGRAKDLIISGGFNVYPAEVEAAIEVLDGVAEVAVIGAPHPDFGEGVVAVVVPRAGAEVSPHAVSDALRETLAAYKRPKTVLIRDALPRNAMGKVEKAVLRRELASAFD